MKRDRKEISRLKREMLQLRKLLEKKQEQDFDRDIEAEEEEAKEVEAKTKDAKIKCPKCKGDAELIDLGSRGTYKVCLNTSRCWHRQKVK
jgi:DNA-directed RNA polymerase subunit M/transcription elongation factor TFIIS